MSGKDREREGGEEGGKERENERLYYVVQIMPDKGV